MDKPNGELPKQPTGEVAEQPIALGEKVWRFLAGERLQRAPLIKGVTMGTLTALYAASGGFAAPLVAAAAGVNGAISWGLSSLFDVERYNRNLNVVSPGGNNSAPELAPQG